MAMNKTEKARLLQAEIKGSLHYSPKYGPDVPPPSAGERGLRLTTGYHYNPHTLRVCLSCSSSISHGIGSTDKTNTQRPIHLYSTKLKALVDMRHDVCMKAATQLHRIDELIYKEQANT